MTEGKLKNYAKLARIEYSAFSVVAVIGALTVAGDALEISHFILLFIINVITLIWGFVHNDYCDIEIDRHSEELSERLLVKGTVSRKAALTIIISGVLINLTLPLIFISSILPILILATCMILAALYNMFSKKLVSSDIFYAGSATLLCLFGALAVSDSTQGLQGIAGLTWIILAIMFIDHFFFNAIEGGLKDVRNDRKVGAKTIASYLVVTTGKRMTIRNSFKAIAISLKVAIIILVFIPILFLYITHSLWQIILLIIMALRTLVLTVRILNIDSFDREKIGRYSIKQEVACKSLVPLMLVGFVGGPWALSLLLLPPLWFILFNYILHGKLLALPKSF